VGARSTRLDQQEQGKQEQGKQGQEQGGQEQAAGARNWGERDLQDLFIIGRWTFIIGHLKAARLSG